MTTLQQTSILNFISEELNNRLIEGEIISSLEKGAFFVINSVIYTVSYNGQKRIQIKDSQGRTYTWGKAGRTIYPQGDKAKNLSKDISGVVLVDLVNRKNPLHNLHKLTLLLIHRIEEQGLVEKLEKLK